MFSFLPLIQQPLEKDNKKDSTLTDNQEPPAKAISRFRFTESSQKVWLPRGDTTKERSLIRRMERKKVEFHLNYNPNMATETKEESSWFWKSSQKKDDSDPLPTSHLGKVVLELKHLLNRNCIAGDFPLVMNGKLVGGIARLCLRTDAALDPTQFEPVEGGGATTSIRAHAKQLVFSRPKIEI